MIGANGAGKTTLLRAIAGAVPVTAGSISFDGTDLAVVPDHRRVGLGIALVPEGRRLFPSLSVRENLEIGWYGARPGPWTVEKVLGLFPLIEPPPESLSDARPSSGSISRRTASP